MCVTPFQTKEYIILNHKIRALVEKLIMEVGRKRIVSFKGLL